MNRLMGGSAHWRLLAGGRVAVGDANRRGRSVVDWCCPSEARQDAEACWQVCDMHAEGW